MAGRKFGFFQGEGRVYNGKIQLDISGERRRQWFLKGRVKYEISHLSSQ
jgi:hypothetical protein